MDFIEKKAQLSGPSCMKSAGGCPMPSDFREASTSCFPSKQNLLPAPRELYETSKTLLLNPWETSRHLGKLRSSFSSL